MSSSIFLLAFVSDILNTKTWPNQLQSGRFGVPSLQFDISAKYEKIDILDSVKKLPLTLTDLNRFHLISSLQIFFRFSTSDVAFLLLLLLLLLLFRVLNIFGLLTLLRALTLGVPNAKFLTFGIPNIKNHISSDVPKLRACLVHVFENMCFVVWKHVWKYV